MREETKSVYIAEDGKIFDNPVDCEKYELELKKEEKTTSYWRVIHGPDLTEGRGYSKMTLVKVCGVEYESYRQVLITDWCFRTMGRMAAFIQGVAPMANWTVSKIDKEQYNDSNAYIQIGDYRHIANRKILIQGEREIGLIEEKGE